MDVIQGGKFTKNRAVSLVNDLKQVDRACGMLQEKLGLVLEYVEDVLVSDQYVRAGAVMIQSFGTDRSVQTV